MADAKAWARQAEASMDRGDFIPSTAAQQTTVYAALDRYRTEIFPRLARDGRDEKARLQRLAATLGDLSLSALDAHHIAKYRDDRLKAGAAPQTVKHDLGLLGRALKCCVMDWGIHLPKGIVTSQVRKPSLLAGRDRRLVGDDEERLLAAASLKRGST